MKASFKTHKDGSIALRLDVDAARAVFASVVFSSRFHDAIAPLVPVAELALRQRGVSGKEAFTQCQ
jgi:hypothetical protein